MNVGQKMGSKEKSRVLEKSHLQQLWRSANNKIEAKVTGKGGKTDSKINSERNLSSVEKLSFLELKSFSTSKLHRKRSNKSHPGEAS